MASMACGVADLAQHTARHQGFVDDGTNMLLRAVSLEARAEFAN
jgi:hypothetical protein